MSKIRVKKPFDFILEEKEKKEEKKEKQEEHEENEEKPLADSQQHSEDFHGGNESTESLPNTPNSSQSQSQSQQSAKQEEIDQSSSQNYNDQSSESSDSDENGEEAEDVVGEGNGEEEGEENREEGEREGEIEEDSEDNSGEEAEDEGEENSEDNEDDAEEDDYSEEGSEEGGDSEAEDNEEGDEDVEGEESDEQQYSYQYNTQQVVNLNDVSAATKFYQTEFYRFIEVIAEEKLKVYDYHNFDEYNIKKLMFRQFEKKSLNHYKMSRVKDCVVLILDNSGSMLWWATNLQILANLALARGDTEIFIAPNGYIEEKLTTKRKRTPIEHEAVMKQLKGRKIIYVGDFDGADTPILLSWCNDVIWVCPESRYRRFRSHDWVSYSEDEFRGVFIRAFNLEEMFSAFKRVNRLFKLWIDLHENDSFDDD